MSPKKEKHMRLNHLILSGAIVVGAILIAAGFPATPAVVASVDLEKVYRSLDQLKAADTRAGALRVDLDKRLAEMTESVRAMQEDLESFQLGTAAHNAALDKAILKAGDLNALQNFAKLKLESEQANAVRDAYATIRSTCAQLSKELKIDFVFIDDTVPLIAPTDLEGTMRQISGRRMLYATPTLDISDALIERLNSNFRTANPGSTTPAPTVPAASTPPATTQTQPQGPAQGKS